MAVGEGLLSGTSINFSGFGSLWPTVWLWLKIFGGVLVVAGGAVVVYFLFYRYPIKVTILRSVGRGVKILKDNARITTTKDGTRVLQLMRLRNGGQRVGCPVPPNSMKTLLGRSDHFFFFYDDNGQLQNVPFTVRDEKNYLELWAEDRLGWARKEDKRRMEKYQQQQLWQQLAPYAVLGMTLMIVFLICYFAFAEIGNGFQQVSSHMADLISILQRTVG